MALLDLYNREVRIGDRVVVGKDWARDCDYLVTGIVKNIKTTNSGDIATIEIDHNGRWNYGKDTSKISKYERQFAYKNIGREHNNILIL